MKNENVICIMAKNPQPGRVKCELESCLSRAQAAALDRAFLLDTISTALRVPGCDVSIGYWPPESGNDFEDIICLFQNEERNRRVSARAGEIALIPQSGANPGERITSLAARLFEDGAKRILFTCSDNPLIEPIIFKASFELLKKHSAVIGPTFDGGYYVLGLSRPDISVFDSINWNSDGLYRQITEKLNADLINWQELELSYDIDRPAELEQLYFDIDNLRLAGKNLICYHTEKCLANFKK